MTFTPDAAKGRIEDLRKEIKKISYSDPFTENTRKIKKNLLLFSSITIIVKAYNLRLDEIPFLHIKVPDEAPHLLEGVLAASLVYFFVFFCVGAYQDLKSWNLKKGDARLRIVWDIFHRLDEGLQYQKNLLEKCLDVKVAPEKLILAEEYASKMSKELDGFSVFLKEVYAETKQFSRAQNFRVWGLEVILPFSLGVFSIIKSLVSFVLLLPVVF